MLDVSYFETEGLELNPWRKNFSLSECGAHRKHHKAALQECVTSAKKYKWILVVDTDEFVWFNTSKFVNLHDLIVTESMDHKAAMLGMDRSFWNVNLCDNTEEGRSFWDVPYHRESDSRRYYEKNMLRGAGKYLVQPEYVGYGARVEEHTVRGHFDGGKALIHLDEAHVNHFRGFASWNGSCENGLGREWVEKKLQPDLNNPCLKDWGGRFAKSYNFTMDNSFNMWQDFVKRKMEKII